MDISKVNIFCAVKAIKKGEKATCRCLPILYLVRGLYPEQIENSYNSIIKTVTFKNGQRIRIDMSPKKIGNWPMKRCSTSFIIKEIQIKTMIPLHIYWDGFNRKEKAP